MIRTINTNSAIAMRLNHFMVRKFTKKEGKSLRTEKTAVASEVHCFQFATQRNPCWPYKAQLVPLFYGEGGTLDTLMYVLYKRNPSSHLVSTQIHTYRPVLLSQRMNSISISSCLPSEFVSNTSLEQRLNLPDGWIYARTGIRERRIHRGGVSELAIPAAKELMHSLQLDPASIDAVIFATVTPDHPWPASACKVAHAIGAHNTLAFDISAACSGFLYALQVVHSLITSGAKKNVLLLSGDCMSAVVDPLDVNTSIIFGDGCSASFWNKENIDSLLYIDLGSNGAEFDRIVVNGGGSAQRNHSHLPALFMEGKPTFKLAIEHMSAGIQKLLDKNSLSLDDIDWIVPHQANMRIIQAIIDYLKADPNKVLTNLEWVGNTTNGSIPICLVHHIDKFKPGQLVLLCAFGAGITWGTALIRWK